MPIKTYYNQLLQFIISCKCIGIIQALNRVKAENTLIHDMIKEQKILHVTIVLVF